MNFTGWTDQQVIARTAWAEARSLGSLGMQLTINSGQNRVNSGRTWWGNSLRNVFTCCNVEGVYQYSCWNAGDPNGPLAIITDPNLDSNYAAALDLAQQALDGSLPDRSNGADSYFDRRLPRWPTWSLGRKPTFMLLPHLYFNTVLPA